MKKLLFLTTIFCGVAFAGKATEPAKSVKPTNTKLTVKAKLKPLQQDQCNCSPVSACGSSSVVCYCNEDQKQQVIDLFIKQACGV